MLNINDVNSLFPWRALTTLRTKGPNTDPWGTPQVIDLISSFCSRISWLTVSKVFLFSMHVWIVLAISIRE